MVWEFKSFEDITQSAILFLTSINYEDQVAVKCIMNINMLKYTIKCNKQLL